MLLVTQPNLAIRRTPVRMGQVWSVVEHFGGSYTAASCPDVGTTEDSERGPKNPRGAPNA
jgi:hypothetical protein